MFYWPSQQDPSGKGWVVLLGSIPCQKLRDSWGEIREVRGPGQRAEVKEVATLPPMWTACHPGACVTHSMAVAR